MKGERLPRCRATVWEPRLGSFQCPNRARFERELAFEAGRRRIAPVCGTHARAADPDGYIEAGLSAPVVELVG
jgi:hypothetical protein